MAVDHKKGLEKLFKDLFAGIGKGFLIYLNITLLAAAFLVGFGFGVVFGLSVAFNFGTWSILYILAITTTSSGLIIWDCNRRHHIYDQALTSTRDEMLVWSLLCSIAGAGGSSPPLKPVGSLEADGDGGCSEIDDSGCRPVAGGGGPLLSGV